MLLPWFCKDTSRSSIFSMFWLVAMAVGSGGVSGSGWDRRVGTGGCASPCACPGCPMAISSSGSAAGPGGSSCPQSGDTGTGQCPGTGQECHSKATAPSCAPTLAELLQPGVSDTCTSHCWGSQAPTDLCTQGKALHPTELVMEPGSREETRKSAGLYS